MEPKNTINWLSSIIWSEYFWLPQSKTWDDLRSTNTKLYPQFAELKYTIAMGAFLLILRLLFETFVFLPIGYFFKWTDRNTNLITQIISYLNFGFTYHKSKFKKVAETAWRFTFYSTIWTVGILILKNKPQFYNIDECWRNWPDHPITADVWWYYVIETGFYWSLLFSTFVIDVRRSDYREMMLHHFVTIILLSFSWTCNFVRIGSMVLLCHDTADILLELGKLFRYAKWYSSVRVIFVIFLLTWIGTRLIYFPFYIIYPMLFEAPAFIQKNYRWENILQRPLMPRLIFLMLCVLVVLHVFWTYILLKIAVKSCNGTCDDIREESDEDSKSETKNLKKIE